MCPGNLESWHHAVCTPWHLPLSGNEYYVLVTKGEGLAYVMIVINELVPPPHARYMGGVVLIHMKLQ